MTFHAEKFVPAGKHLVGGGAFRNAGTRTCMDVMSDEATKMKPGLYGCHFQGGAQVGWCNGDVIGANISVSLQSMSSLLTYGRVSS